MRVIPYGATVLLLLLGLVGCAGPSSAGLKRWMSSVEQLRDGRDYNRVKLYEFPARLAPAFHNDLFVPVFGAPYAELSSRQKRAAHRKLLRDYGGHSTQWITLGLGSAFDPHQEGKRLGNLWEKAVARAQGTPFAEYLQKREIGRAEQKKGAKRALLAAKRKKAARRERALKEQRARDKRRKELLKGAAVILGAWVLSERVDRLAEDARVRKIHKKIDRTGGCKTWAQLAGPQLTDEVLSLYPYSWKYRFETDAVRKLLREVPWDQRALNAVTKKLGSINDDHPGVTEKDYQHWRDFQDAVKALRIVKKTPPCR